MRMFSLLLSPALLLSASLPMSARAQETTSKPVVKVGMIGLDTSHAPAFAKQFNDPKRSGPGSDMRVVVAFPGGSPDIPSSRDRVAGYTKDLQNAGATIVDSIDALVSQVDGVLLESVDGRPHLAQAYPVLKAGKPMFIDKPLAGSLADAIAIDMLAKKYKARWFSSSSLRFSSGFIKYRNDEALRSSVRGAASWGPCSLEEHHPDLFWYGVHGVEILYTAMGTGCQQVTRTSTKGTELVVGVWDGGRIGTFRGLRDGKGDYGLTVFGEKVNETNTKYDGYGPLVEQIIKFFGGAPAPVSNEETLELFAFMQAAQESKELGGVPVKVADVVAKARALAEKRVAEIDR